VQAALRGGTLRLRTYERQILVESSPELPKQVYDLLMRQMENIVLCQRSNADRMVQVFFREKSDWSNTDGTVELLRGTVRSSDGSAKVPFSVFQHRGRLSSIEFRKSPKSLNDGTTDVLFHKKPWGRQRPMSEIIDAQEHD
jgi:hypothetical protein